VVADSLRESRRRPGECVEHFIKGLGRVGEVGGLLFGKGANSVGRRL
jgi:hypothetical protein